MAAFLAAATVTAAGCASAAAPVPTATTTATHTTTTRAATAAPSPVQTGPVATNCPRDDALGKFAFIDRGSLRVLSLSSCRIQTVRRHRAQGPVTWSADGRYLGFGNGAVVPAAGGGVEHPLGKLVQWTWAPRGHTMAGVTDAGTPRRPLGGVVVGGPGRRPDRVLPDDWQARGVVYSRDGGSLAVSRGTGIYGQDRFHGRQELWAVDVTGGNRQQLWSRKAMTAAGPHLARFSPDGREILFWTDTSASINSDGQPLEAVPATGGKAVDVTSSLLYPDYVTACGSRVVVASGGGRESSERKRLVSTGGPNWRAVPLTSAEPLSWSSPSCPRSGRLVAAAAGPSSRNSDVGGSERRSIFMLPIDGGKPSRLTARPGPGTSDELPRFSADGSTILFVRTDDARGSRPTGDLYALQRSARNWRHHRLYGPIVQVGGVSRYSYYGHYGWADTTDWYQPPR